MKIGFVGQGFVGKNIANDIESRGYTVVRYALEPEYIGNRESLVQCEIVFIAVPTPTTPHGFNFSIVEESLTFLTSGTIAVIKSTLLPGTTRTLQERFPHLIILFSPEFLCETTAAHDAANPIMNVLGVFSNSTDHRTAAETVMCILPKSANAFIVSTEAAELFKYVHNIHGFMRVVFSNLCYDLGGMFNVMWEQVEQIMNVDPMMSSYYNSPLHKSGRGAGGHCFIKDMAAFSRLYAEQYPEDQKGIAVFRSMELKNLELLSLTGKSQDLVQDVYGDITKKNSFTD